MAAKVVKSTKSTNVTKVAPAVSEPATPAMVASVNPVPAVISAPPEGWVEPARLGKKGKRPKTALILAAPALATELRKSAPALLQELGPNAVDPQQLAAALETASAWRSAEAKASTFHMYARSQRAASGDAALTLMAGLKAGVRYAISRDASFADRFPDVAKVFAQTRRPKKSTEEGTAATPNARARKNAAAGAAEPATAAVAPAAAPRATAAGTATPA
jgi:hypothetical protein